MATLSDPHFPFQVSYPDPTPAGYEVVAHVRQGERGFRINLISEGSQEVYFEAGQYPQLVRQAGIDEFMTDVSARLESLHQSEIIEIDWHGLPAARFSIDWPGRERILLFFEREDVLYRILYDPASQINLEILDSFTWTPGE